MVFDVEGIVPLTKKNSASSGRRFIRFLDKQHFYTVNESEMNVTGMTVNSAPDNEDKLSDGKLCRHQVFFLVNVGHTRFWASLNNHYVKYHVT